MNGKNGTVKWLIGLSFTILVMIVSLTLNIVNRVREASAMEYRKNITDRLLELEITSKDHTKYMTILQTDMASVVKNQDEMKKDIKELLRQH